MDFYPTVKVGDFGLAEQISLDDPLNPSKMRGYGTKGWQAPVRTTLGHSIA